MWFEVWVSTESYGTTGSVSSVGDSLGSGRGVGVGVSDGLGVGLGVGRGVGVGGATVGVGGFGVGVGDGGLGVGVRTGFGVAVRTGVGRRVGVTVGRDVGRRVGVGRALAVTVGVADGVTFGFTLEPHDVIVIPTRNAAAVAGAIHAFIVGTRSPHTCSHGRTDTGSSIIDGADRDSQWPPGELLHIAESVEVRRSRGPSDVRRW